jgi:hypothetical protein
MAEIGDLMAGGLFAAGFNVRQHRSGFVGWRDDLIVMALWGSGEWSLFSNARRRFVGHGRGWPTLRRCLERQKNPTFDLPYGSPNKPLIIWQRGAVMA